MTLNHFGTVAFVAIACTAVDCGDQSIIAEYRAAECVPPSANPGVSPRTREWEAELHLGDGRRVSVHGAEIPGGEITVWYPPNINELVAVNAGDYVYPADVRVDPQNGRLYVKAHGLAGGVSEETWLFRYDLRNQKLSGRIRVPNDIPVDECPAR